MQQNDQTGMSKATEAEVLWNGGKPCKGCVQIRSDGWCHFVLDGGQSFDGCPPSGAILRVPGHFGSADRYEILGFEYCTFESARNFRTKKLPDAPDPGE